MTIALALALGIAALVHALVRRWRRSEAIDLEACVIIATAVLTIVGLAATLLAVAGVLAPASLLASVIAVAALVMPWRAGATIPGGSIDLRRLGATIALLAVAAALRWPPIDYALAGRDQGTYVLRAASTARTGGISIIDDVVRDATPPSERPGPGDIAGLYPKRAEAWRDDVYEAGYRPGWYLADRERGLVVPQFFHLHPSLLTVALWLGGSAGPGTLMVVEGLLAILALFALARRLLGSGPWPGLAAAAFAVSPLVIWVHRNTLTEALTGLLTIVATLLCVRARDGARGPGLVAAALVLGATAWIRGNAWITAPVVLAMLWLVPAGERRHRATGAYVGVLAGSVIVHAWTVFPYLHDELVRQFAAWATPSPLLLVGGFGVGIVAWWSVDEIVFGPRSRCATKLGASVRPRMPMVVIVAFALAFVAWAVRAAAADGAPWSRLDALGGGVGAVLLVPAAIGIAIAVRRWPTHDASAANVWLLAIAALVGATAWTYAGRNLPKFGLYYYGRYLVPELVPLGCLGSAYAMQRIHGWIATRRRRAADVGVGLVAIAQLVVIAWPLAATPSTRLVEFEGAGRIVDAIAQRVPNDAIVVAGGEGWHHGHTFNQVAGALAMRHGRSIVPYHSREAAYATLYELLLAGPAASDEPPPRVFLLVNEATHALASSVRGQPIAALDDGLPPGLVAASVTTLELVTDRLTPTNDAVPTAVTRDSLRMALIEVIAAPHELHVLPQSVCLDPDRATEIEIPADVAQDVAAVVIVADPQTSRRIDAWTVTIDGTPRRSRGPGASARGRDTLGPYAVLVPPCTIAIRAAIGEPTDDRCPHGGLAEIRLLGRERPALGVVPTESLVFEPDRDLGHAVTPVAWVSGRGLSRLRPMQGEPTAKANALALRGAASLQFDPDPHAPGSFDVVVNLTATSLSPAARIRVWAGTASGEVQVGEIDPPDERERSWQSPALPYAAPGAVTQWRLELVDADVDDVAWIRDIGLFLRAP